MDQRVLSARVKHAHDAGQFYELFPAVIWLTVDRGLQVSVQTVD